VVKGRGREELHPKAGSQHVLHGQTELRAVIHGQAGRLSSKGEDVAIQGDGVRVFLRGNLGSAGADDPIARILSQGRGAEGTKEGNGDKQGRVFHGVVFFVG
jgi:hypothetical protein